MENTPKIIDRVRSKIRLKHYSISTEKAYIATPLGALNVPLLDFTKSSFVIP